MRCPWQNCLGLPPGRGFLNLLAAVTATWAMLHFCFDSQEKVWDPGTSPPLPPPWQHEQGRRQGVDKHKEKARGCALTLTVHRPGEHQEHGEHSASEQMHLALLQDLNLGEGSAFGGLGQSATSLHHSSWYRERESRRHLLDLGAESGTERIYSDSSLPPWCCWQLFASSVSALDQPGGKLPPDIIYTCAIVCIIQMQFILLSGACTKLWNLVWSVPNSQFPCWSWCEQVYFSVWLQVGIRRLFRICITAGPGGGQPCLFTPCKLCSDTLKFKLFCVTIRYRRETSVTN